MEYIYTIDELTSLFESNTDCLHTLRKKYVTQGDLLLRLRVHLIDKCTFHRVKSRNNLRLVLKEAKGRDELMLPQRDHVRWHTFTTEQYREAKALVKRMEENEKEMEMIVNELEIWIVGCGWGLEMEVEVEAADLKD